MYDVSLKLIIMAIGKANNTTKIRTIITPHPSLRGRHRETTVAKITKGIEKIADILKAGERYFLPQISLEFKFLLITSTPTTAFLYHIIPQNLYKFNIFS